jgi:hypothetical protein
MKSTAKDAKRLSEIYENAITQSESGGKYNIGGVVQGHDGEEAIVNIDGDTIYTRVLDDAGNVYRKNSNHNLGDIISLDDFEEEVIVSIQGDKIYTRVTNGEGSEYTRKELDRYNP